MVFVGGCCEVISHVGYGMDGSGKIRKVGKCGDNDCDVIEYKCVMSSFLQAEKNLFCLFHRVIIIQSFSWFKFEIIQYIRVSVERRESAREKDRKL